MKKHLFQTLTPHIEGNKKLREPQREAYAAIAEHFAGSENDREVGIVLPVGCGKSGLITIAPFAVHAVRALVIAPGIRIAKQLHEKDFNSTHAEFFYGKCAILPIGDYPEAAEIRGRTSNRGDLDDADVVITNIQQLQGTDNRWLTSLPADYFDIILVDEAHHNVADSWDKLRQQFPKAKIVNVSATPARADGQIMTGKIIYSFPVARAIQDGYVKRLKAVVLNPASLKFVREENGVEEEISRAEVQRLGESDAEFRRSILTSKESLATIVDCSIQQLQKLRTSTGEKRHKIIASALNYRHCIQVKEAYEARELRAAYIHSKEEEITDDVLQRLENNELDVIIQVRKLGEGFDHKYLSVAAICSIFSNLSPFVQFVGRIMRVVDRDNPGSLNNQGIVVFHAGANVAKRWADFKDFSEADKKYFDELMPTEEVLDFTSTDELVVDPQMKIPFITPPAMKIITQSGVAVEEDDLVKLTSEQQKALDLLLQSVDADQLLKHIELERIRPRKQQQRRAARKALDDEIRNVVGRILATKGFKPKGRNLAKKSGGKDNFTYVKSVLDRKATELVSHGLGERAEWSADEIEQIRAALPTIADQVGNEL